MKFSVPQFALDFTGSLPHPDIDMRKCIICRAAFEPNGNPNKNKQLTCSKPACQRALKTIRQTLRREKVRKIRKKK